MKGDAPIADPAGAAPRTLVCGGNPGRWSWRDREHEAPTMNGVEAWVFALRADYINGGELRRSDLDGHDLVILNLNFDRLPHYLRVLEEGGRRRARVVGLYEGDLAMLHDHWKAWSRVADRCDLIIAINGHGVSFLQSLTSAPVSFIGIPYPVDGIAACRVPVAERRREIYLCAPPLRRPLDYLAVRDLRLPMYAYERSFSRRLPDLIEHRSLDKLRYVRRAGKLYDDRLLAIHPITHLPGFFEQASRSLFWVNLDTRYTWGRYVIDAAALAMPVITTRETWHGPRLFPDLVVDSPYDMAGARTLADRLLSDPSFYADAIERALGGLDWYRPEATARRLWEAVRRGGKMGE